MAQISKERLYDILRKPNKECDGYEIHVKHVWKTGDSRRIFELTGLMFEDFKKLLKDE